MRYFNVSFCYKLPESFPQHVSGGGIHLSFGNCEEDPDSNAACALASEGAEKALSTLDLEFIHAYVWPDGSCYRDARVKADSELADVEALTHTLNEYLTKNEDYAKIKLQVESVTLANEKEIPRHEKISLEEKFNLKPNEQYALVVKRQTQEDVRLKELLVLYAGDRNKAVDQLYSEGVQP